MTQILIAEDSEKIASFIAKGLENQGYQVTHAATGDQAMRLLELTDFDLLILDIGLPNIDGFTILERLRGSGNTMPVIILSARASVPDRLAGLESGADDYVPKPFSLDELLLRVRLRLRKPTEAPSNQVLEHGGIRLDLINREVTVNSKVFELTSREFALLELLLRNAGQLMTREQLLSRVWGYEYDPGTNIVDVYIRYLRQKLGNDAIRTVRGIGYRID